MDSKTTTKNFYFSVASSLLTSCINNQGLDWEFYGHRPTWGRCCSVFIAQSYSNGSGIMGCVQTLETFPPPTPAFHHGFRTCHSCHRSWDWQFFRTSTPLTCAQQHVYGTNLLMMNFYGRGWCQLCSWSLTTNCWVIKKTYIVKCILFRMPLSRPFFLFSFFQVKVHRRKKT